MKNNEKEIQMKSFEFDDISTCPEHIKSYQKRCVILILSNYYKENESFLLKFKQCP